MKALMKFSGTKNIFVSEDLNDLFDMEIMDVEEDEDGNVQIIVRHNL